MRPLVYRLALLSCLAAAACSSKPGTYVHLRFSPGAGLDASGATQIDVTATLAGQTAKVTIGNGKALTLPADAVLEIRHNEGALKVDAILRGAGGTQLATASATQTITRGATIDLPLTFVGEPPPPPPGMAMLTMDHQPGFDFGTVVVGTSSAALTLTVTNDGNATSSALGPATLGDATQPFTIAKDGCNGQTLDAGASCTVQVTLDGKSAGMPATTLSVTAASGGTVSSQLKGTVILPGTLGFDPPMQDYKGLLTGTFVDQPFKLTNNGAEPSGTIKLQLTGTDAGSFALLNNQCDGNTLAIGASCTVTVRFNAGTTSGARSATLEADATPGGPAVANLKGLAQNPAQLSLAPGGSTYNFNAVDVTAPQSVTFTLSNLGDQDTGNLGPANWLTGDPAFSLGNGTCVDGTPLKGGTNCTIVVTFKPTTSGARNATLTITGTPGGNLTVTLSGTGRVTNTLLVGKSGAGAGTIASVPAGTINCGSTCSASISFTDTAPTVTLSATPANTSNFGSWSNCTPVTGQPTQCTVTMDVAKSVTASFTLKPAVLGLTPGPSKDVGYVGIGSSNTTTFTLANSGYDLSGNLPAQSTWVSGGAFSVSSTTCTAGAGVAAQASCNVVVKFTPTAEGVASGTLSMPATPGGSPSVSLTGEACKTGNHICGSTCYSTIDRAHCGSTCGTCTNTQVCDTNSCVAPPALTIASAPMDPTGWTDSAGKPIVITINPVSLPGVTYQCRTGPESTFTATVPAWANCDGASGTGTTHTPTSNASIPAGSYRTEVRYLHDTYVSPTTTVRYYTHHSLDAQATCPRNANDAPHFTDDQFFTAAQNYANLNAAKFPLTASFPAPGNPPAASDAIVLRNPFLKIPFVGVAGTNSIPWAKGNFTVTEPMLRHRLVLNGNRTMLLVRRQYVSTKLADCRMRMKARSGRSALYTGKIDCEALVLNNAGAGLCMVSDGKSPASAVPLAYDAVFGAPTAGTGTVSMVSGSPNLTITGGSFNATMRGISVNNVGFLQVLNVVSATQATLAKPAPLTTSQTTWQWTTGTDINVFPVGLAKLFGDGHFSPGHRTKCTTAGCNSAKPWLLYLPP